MIYLDSNANYPPSDTVLRKFAEGCSKRNISSYIDTKTAEEINNLKNTIAYLSGDPNINYEMIFTSGGSESNSTVINHFFYKAVSQGTIPAYVCMMSEHSSVVSLLQQLESDNMAKVTWLKPKWTGEFPITVLASILEESNPDCVFCQSVNSETGCINDIGRVQEIINEFNRNRNADVNLAIDNVQGFARINYPESIGDFISISLHKIGAPIGIGVLMYREDIDLHPLVGGKQNGGKRGGTYNVGSIFAANQALKEFKYQKCCQSCSKFINIVKSHIRTIQYEDYLKLPDKNGAYIVTFNAPRKLEHVFMICIVVDGQALCGRRLKKIFEDKKIIIGTGSACGTANRDTGMGLSDIVFKGGLIRFSFHCNSKIEVNKAAKLLVDITNHFTNLT